MKYLKLTTGGVLFKELMEHQKEKPKEPITIALADTVLSQYEILAIYDILAMYSQTMDIIGHAVFTCTANTLACLTALPVERRVISKNAIVLFEEDITYAGGTVSDIIIAGDQKQEVNDSLKAILSTRSGIGFESIVDMFSKRTYISASECVKLGLMGVVVGD